MIHSKGLIPSLAGSSGGTGGAGGVGLVVVPAAEVGVATASLGASSFPLGNRLAKLSSGVGAGGLASFCDGGGTSFFNGSSSSAAFGARFGCDCDGSCF